MDPRTRLVVALLAACLDAAALGAEPLTVTISSPPAALTEGFRMGTARSPSGSTITLDSRSLLRDGRPWTPAMGEYHYSRYPEGEWREELLKMKAGGIDIVATYVFWIHHEEIEGQFDWSGRRSLRRFIETVQDAGLTAIVRCGPWCHGEVRNGGFPDWLLQKGWRLRSNDPNYLDKARILYGQIAEQIRGLLWKDGGPVIGIQLDNEYGGDAEYLLSLKRIAQEAGLDVPLYTRTGWPALRTPMPFGEMVPLYGAYAEGFWDRELTPMPGRYWSGFHFSLLRLDSNIANEILGRRDAQDANDAAQYPYLTCEVGGGMMNSYHRRVLVYPLDIESTTLVKVGSGSTSPGYYMYHGGVNPEGRLTTLMESQSTTYTNWNDLPVRSYDFQAPLGQYGQIRPHYHLLRRLHLFLGEWGSALAGMPPTLPDLRPTGRDDVRTLRWAVRSDGRSGFVFVNNYERLKPMPAKPGVQFALRLPDTALTFPSEPVTLPADHCLIWPFNLDLGHGVVLAWATAQPVTAAQEGPVRTVFFAETPGVRAEFALDAQGLAVKVLSDRATRLGDRLLVHGVKPGRRPAVTIQGADGGTVQIVLLSQADSLALWKGHWQGRDRAFLTQAGLVLDGDSLRLTSARPADLSVGVWPVPDAVASEGKVLSGKTDGVFRRFAPRAPRSVSLKGTCNLVQEAGPAREVPLGKIRQPVAAAPEDADFDRAAVWQIRLPLGLDLATDPILRLHYVGDAARVTLNGRLVTDDFYNGNPFEIGLARHMPKTLKGDLRVAILPLRKDAPVYMAPSARPEFGKAESVVKLSRVELVPRYQVRLTGR